MQEPLPTLNIEKVIADSGIVEGLCDEPLNPAGKREQTSTLIAFPGTSRPLPEWRKQLSQRVREVQERRAREAAEEAAAAREAGMVSCSLPSVQLELVPDLEQAVINPIVSKALERIERARRPESSEGNFTGAATAPALEADIEAEAASDPEPVEIKPKLSVVAPSQVRPESSSESEPRATPQHKLQVPWMPKLAMAAPPKIDVAEPLDLEMAEPPELEAAAAPKPEVTERKPIRVISDSVDDVALSYLETCLSLPAHAADSVNESAGFPRRVIAGTFDLLLVALMAAPAAAAIEFSDGNWSDPRVIGLMSGITVVTAFAYFTISIALTGRTLAMRIFSLRTIDIRTGLIPTGGQAMKRASGYIFALAIIGLGVLYALIDPDGRTIYDRFSKTIVIRD